MRQYDAAATVEERIYLQDDYIELPGRPHAEHSAQIQRMLRKQRITQEPLLAKDGKIVATSLFVSTLTRDNMLVLRRGC